MHTNGRLVAIPAELRSLRAALCEIAAVLARGRRAHPDDDGFRQTTAFHIERARRQLASLERVIKTALATPQPLLMALELGR